MQGVRAPVFESYKMTLQADVVSSQAASKRQSCTRSRFLVEGYSLQAFQAGTLDCLSRLRVQALVQAGILNSVRLL